MSFRIVSRLDTDMVNRKNVTKGYSDAQVKVRKATSNEAWGPEGADMAEIAQMTFDRYFRICLDIANTLCSHDFLDVMDMLDRRMNDRGKMWRHVYKVSNHTVQQLSIGITSLRLLRSQRFRECRSMG
jgi:ENTH domain